MEHTTIILIRHGETVANRENIFRGRMDFPLNEVGIHQAECLAKELLKFKIDAIYSSPLSRALDTAKPIAAMQNLEIEIEPDLANISLGIWEGMPHKEVSQKFPQEYHLWKTEPEKLKIPGGENLADVQSRSVSAIERIIQKHKGRTIAAVTHRAVVKPLIAGLIGIPAPYFWKIHMDNASYSIIHHNDLQGYLLYQLNCNRHLDKFVVEE